MMCTVKACLSLSCPERCTMDSAQLCRRSPAAVTAVIMVVAVTMMMTLTKSWVPNHASSVLHLSHWGVRGVA